MWTLAKRLARRSSLRVALLTTAPRPIMAQSLEGVALWVHVDRWRTMRREVGDAIDLTGWRLKRWDARLLWRLPLLALTRPWRPRDPSPTAADPRLLPYRPRCWVVFGVSDDSARAIAAAQQQGIPSLLFLQSNADLDPAMLVNEPQGHPYGESREGRLFALRQADRIVCQTEWQQQQLRQRFGRRSDLVRNPIDAARWRLPKPATHLPALWVGRFDDFHKRPGLLFELAERCPQLSFTMVCNRFDPLVERRLRTRLPANVELIDYVPFSQMPGLFQQSSAFVSTGSSTHEGFPNVMLQAAASHTPIYSLEDYDDFLHRSGAGVICATIAEMAERLTADASQGGMSVDWGQVDDYLATHHDEEHITDRAAEIITSLIDS
ncbi:MAG: hypothetical protein KatS3mg111_1416 [Pirellulaceae bacterium]|nr:MAG: hypothetical protein KatS3mg111_1416 [Pirellulaceae bacterium]